jgi:hypothetical protein
MTQNCNNGTTSGSRMKVEWKLEWSGRKKVYVKKWNMK